MVLVAPLIGRLAIPPRCLGGVPCHALSLVVHDPEAALGDGIALVGGLANPHQSFIVILLDALAPVVLGSEVELGLGIALVGGFAVPLHRFRIALRHALATFVHDPEVELGYGIALPIPPDAAVRGASSSDTCARKIGPAEAGADYLSCAGA